MGTYVKQHLSEMLIVLIAVIAGSTQCNAQWYGENVEPGADVIMMDIRWPWWAESTYSANFNIATVPGGVSAYGGFAGSVETIGSDHRPNLDPEVQGSFRPGSVWSFWGSNAEGEPVRVVTASEHTFAYQYIGEGASGALFGTWPVIRQNRWYTMLKRIWSPAGQTDPKTAYVGRWVRDVEADRWYLYGVMRLPIPATGFTGNAGFLEDFGHSGRSARSIHRRFGYYRKEGRWKTSNEVHIEVHPRGRAVDDHWIVNRLEDDTVLAMEVSQNRKLVPQLLMGEPLEYGRKHTFKTKQPDLPILDSPEVTNVQARSNGHQVWVSWQVPDSASPQWSWKVEIFDNAACEGDPIAVREKRLPITRNVIVEAEQESPTVRFTMVDVFDQPIEPVIVRADAAEPDRSVAEDESTPEDRQPVPVPGMQYEFRVQDKERHANVIYPPSKAAHSRNERHHWLSLDEIETGRLVRQGVCRGLDIELRGTRREGYAFRFRGLLRVPRTGYYLFYMKGTDGYRIQIDEHDTLVWDGLHGPEEKSAGMHLTAGDHPIAVDYFVDKNKPFFLLEWEGPDLERQVIPASAFFHRQSGRQPDAEVKVAPSESGRIDAEVVVAPNGHLINRIEFYFDTMQISSSKHHHLKYSGVLPGGKHRVWARIYYDSDHTLDTEFSPITVDSKSPTGWNLSIAGEQNLGFNILQTAPDAFSFVGEGEYVLSRPVEGDFTLTCRVDHCAGMNGEPVNASSWVGLTVREHPERNNYRWGQEFGVMQVAKNGVRTTPDHGDGAGTRQSYQRLPDGHSWLRIVRHGKSWSAWTSPDGESWRFGSVHYKRIPSDAGAGVVFRALPQDARMYFRASVSNVSLIRGVPENFAIESTAVTGIRSTEVTGVIVARTDSNIVVVRTTANGLLRSTDGGRTWNPSNGALTDRANSVRSVAIHPTDPQIMIRATSAGTFRTNDGGKSWQQLPLNCDFDGSGPTAVCGEVVAFVPGKPKTIFAAGETMGLFRSEDGGDSWSRVVDAGNRFTAIDINPYFRNQFGDTVIHAVTCPDQFIELLGRGPSSFRASEASAFDFVSFDDGKSFKTHVERNELGYLNTLSLRCNQSVQLYGTTHGLIHTFSFGMDNCLYSTSLPLESLRPFTAIGGSVVQQQFCTRKFVQAINPETPRRLSRSDLGGDVWSWTQTKGEFPECVLKIVPADPTNNSNGRSWWLVGEDGLYRSSDQCETFRRVGISNTR